MAFSKAERACAMCDAKTRRVMIRRWHTGSVTRQPLCQRHIDTRLPLLRYYYSLHSVKLEKDDGTTFKVLRFKIKIHSRSRRKA